MKQVGPAEQTHLDTMSGDAESLRVSAETRVRSRRPRHVQYIVVGAVGWEEQSYWPLVSALGLVWLLRRSPSSG